MYNKIDTMVAGARMPPADGSEIPARSASAMGKHSYRLSAASVKNLRGVLLAALASALIFLFSGVVFQSSFYAVPLLALITLPLAIAATNVAWRAASACVAVLVFSLLELTVNVLSLIHI